MAPDAKTFATTRTAMRIPATRRTMATSPRILTTRVSALPLLLIGSLLDLL